MENIQDIKLFTDVFSLEGVKGQVDIDFVNIKMSKDTKLFLDPALIEGQALNNTGFSNEWMQNSNECIKSFFECLFDAYRNNDKGALSELLSYAHEPHETNLGLSTDAPRGKGNTEKGLLNIFKNIKGLLDENLIVNTMDTCVFIEDFAEDGMSDLVTNILRKQLYDFTVSQCEKFNIALSDDICELGYFWDDVEKKWDVLYGKPLMNEHKVGAILLVPKTIVRNAYRYSIGQFFQMKILTDIQEKQFEQKTSLCTMKTSKAKGSYLVQPSKDIVLKEIVADANHKEYAVNYTIENKGLIEEFRSETQNEYSKGGNILTDEKLTEYIQK